MTFLAQFALIAFLAGAGPDGDTVILRSGERLSCVVIEERPAEGVTIQLPNGDLRRLSPAEVQRIEYQDGTVGDLAAPPPVPGPAAPPSVPAPPPPPGPTPAGPSPPPSTWLFATTFGIQVPAGEAANGLAMSSVVTPQFLFGVEAGLRLSPEWLAGLIGDLGVGSTGSSLQHACRADGYLCDTFSWRLGAQLRYAFTPRAPVTWWVAAGAARESTEVSDSEISNNPALVTVSGWEFLRLSVGADFRGDGAVGWSAFGLVGFCRYDTVKDASGTHHPPAPPTHAWIQLGVKILLGP